MAVAHDAATESHTGTTGSANEASFTFSHNPVGTPRGVLVYTFTNANADDATGVTYDGVALAAVSGGRAVDTAGEPGDCKAWFLGSNVPTTDPANVVVSRNNNANVMYAVCITQTADADTEVTGVVLLQDDGTLAEQSVNDGSPGSNSVRYAGVNSGLGTPPAQGTNSTQLHTIDFSARGISVCRETTAGQGARSVGFSSGTSDDRAAVHLAVRQSLNQSIAFSAATLAGVGRAFTVAPGAVSIPMNVGVLAGAGRAFTVDAPGGGASVQMAVGVLSGAGRTFTVVPGAVSIPMSTAVLSSAGRAFTVQPGAVLIALNAAVLAGAGRAFTVVPGGVVIALTTRILASAGRAFTVVPGGVIIPLVARILASAGHPFTPTTPGGAQTVTLTAATLASAGRAFTVAPGGVQIALNSAILASQGRAFSVAPGGVTISFLTTILGSQGRPFSVISPSNQIIALNVAVLASVGRAFTITSYTGAPITVVYVVPYYNPTTVIPRIETITVMEQLRPVHVLPQIDNVS